MNKKNTLVGAIVVLLVGIGAFLFGSNQDNGVVGQIYSPVGTTNSTAKFYSIDAAPATAAATSTSLFNTDSTDRGIQDLTVMCTSVGTSQTFLTGAGLLSNGFNVKAATTSVTSTGLQGNTANIFLATIATTTPYQYVASSTTPFPTDVTRIWPTGTYLTFAFSATNTAACTVGVHAISL